MSVRESRGANQVNETEIKEFVNKRYGDVAKNAC